MRTRLLAVLLITMAVGCASETGVLVTVTQDATVTEPVTRLELVVGVLEPLSGDYIRDDLGADMIVDVSGRDLRTDPATVYLRDRREGPTTLIVAVIGQGPGGRQVAFAGMPAPLAMRDDHVLEVLLTLGGDPGSSTVIPTGCVRWGGNAVVPPSDRDCDGCDDTTGACTECAVATDCDAFGAPPCGAWQCNAGSCDVVCSSCADADLDGYGVGSGCAGADCDDTDDRIVDGTTVRCYSGDPATIGTGVCRDGSRTCYAGTWTPCSGEVIPGGEGCNLEDDDCDGQIDESLGTISCGLGACAATGPACGGGAAGACVPLTGAPDDSACDGADNDCDGSIDEDCTCVLVAPGAIGGNDAQAIASNNMTPFLSVQAAIDWAFANAGRPRVVCLASCSSPVGYLGPITMRPGIHLAGGYDLARNRCGTPAVIQTGTATGILFDAQIQVSTTLDRVIVNRIGNTATTAGVTLDGATAVTLNAVQITNTSLAGVGTSIGVDLRNAAEALITQSRINGGSGTALTIGIRSVGSRPTIRDNCSGYDAQGRCNRYCDQLGWIAGRTIDGLGTGVAIWLEDSAGAVVDTSSVCTTHRGDEGYAVRITGNATGVAVRRNYLDSWGAAIAASAVLAEDCAGTAPWITDNTEIWAGGDLPSTDVATVRALGDCHPVIEANTAIYGGSEGGAVSTTGVYCGASSSSTVPSRCVVVDNPLIQSTYFGVPPTSTGIRCEDGGCMRIARNFIDARSGVRTTGVHLGRTGALVENNRIEGGCGATESIGVRAVTSSARLENNQIFAGTCINPGTAGVFVGLDALLEAGPSELDVHSNHIDGDGATACTSVGIRLREGSSAPTAGSGRYRNNIIRAGRCAAAYGIEETTVRTDPRMLKHNDLAPLDSPTALYRDEGTTDLTDAMSVDALTDLDVASTLSVDPRQSGYPIDLHLELGSVCAGAGTTSDAPPFDMDGDPRDAAPDIGPDEI